MSRIRTIKPELLSDEKTASLSHAAHRLFIGCILLADDYGRFRATPRHIHAAVFWAHDVDVVALLHEVEAVGLVHTYEVREQRYGVVTSWAKHQKVDHPGRPLCPGPEEATEGPGGGGPSGSTPSPGGSENGSRETREPLANGSGPQRDAAPKPSRLTGTGTGTGIGPVALCPAPGGRVPGQPSALVLIREDPTPPSDVVLSFPTRPGNRGGPRVWHFICPQLALLVSAYPAVNVLVECKRARVWIEGHPDRLKTAGRMLAFLDRWLSKAQDGGPGLHQARPARPADTPLKRIEVPADWPRSRQLP